METSPYLHRIGMSERITPDLQNLVRLQSNHMFHVPFENFDIYNGIPVKFSVESFYRKIVSRKRGGYCYELNGLFHWLLRSLGYDSMLISALVAEKGGFLTEFEHMAIVVTILGQRYLVDVGFGDNPLTPMALIPGKIQTDAMSDYHIADDSVVDGKNHLSLEKWNPVSRTFVTKYYFTLAPRSLEYFEIMHQYQEVVPSSYYKRRLICSLPTSDGRISLVGNRLIETVGNRRRIRTIEDIEEMARVGRAFFDLDVSFGETSEPIEKVPVAVTPAHPGNVDHRTTRFYPFSAQRTSSLNFGRLP